MPIANIVFQKNHYNKINNNIIVLCGKGYSKQQQVLRNGTKARAIVIVAATIITTPIALLLLKKENNTHATINAIIRCYVIG